MNWLGDYRNAVKEYARDYVLENTGLKVLALLITAVLWLSVASRPVSQIALNGVPIEFHNWPESPNLTVSKYETLAARVYLEGPREVLESLRGAQFTVAADMTGVEPGVRLIPLNIDAKSLPANVRVKEIEPRKIRVTVERVVEREVPIVPRFEGKPSADFEIIDWHITPDTVKIGGAESQVRDITEVSTETVRLTDRAAPFTDLVAIDIGSPNLSLSDSSGGKVTLSVNIGELRKQRVVANVPVAVLGAPPRVRAFPATVSVTVYGPRSAVDSLIAGDLNASVEYQRGVRDVVPKIKLSLDLADQVVVRSIEPQRVRLR
jgi:YbbR domain-containing protein